MVDMTTLKKKFGFRLRQIRRVKNLTQEELAEAIGVSTEFISYLERGIHAPSFETLDKLALALDTPLHELFDFRGLE